MKEGLHNGGMNRGTKRKIIFLDRYMQNLQPTKSIMLDPLHIEMYSVSSSLPRGVCVCMYISMYVCMYICAHA